MIRVFIADDFRILVEDLEDMIGKQEDMCVVGTACSGRETLSKLQSLQCDIVLMDIEMEEKNTGILVTENLREIRPDLKIIFLTAHDTEQIIITAMGAGAVDYIVKGVSEEEALLHIRAAFNGKTLLDNKVRKVVLREYTRARRSEQSLLYFVNNLSALTAAERELVKLLLDGKKVAQIASIRCVEVVTVKTQIKGLLRKFKCSRTKEIVKMIRDLNLEHLF
ncbi:response regulator transcription factor [Blautia sp. JLR.GB0024]|uniref:response regulator transcription factor n=1 Tax=Blautia sp. JLR.GB0024 TaxID=3123295 RepID=UPI003003A9C2